MMERSKSEVPASIGAADDDERRRAAFATPLLLAARHQRHLLLLHTNRCTHAVDIYSYLYVYTAHSPWHRQNLGEYLHASHGPEIR